MVLCADWRSMRANSHRRRLGDGWERKFSQCRGRGVGRAGCQKHIRQTCAEPRRKQLGWTFNEGTARFHWRVRLQHLPLPFPNTQDFLSVSPSRLQAFPEGSFPCDGNCGGGALINCSYIFYLLFENHALSYRKPRPSPFLNWCTLFSEFIFAFLEIQMVL